MNVVLIATYELGRQPFGLASPAAWLRRLGARVTCLDVSRARLDEGAVRAADLIAFHVPMHTATRLAIALLPAIKELNSHAQICFYGLYAPVNEEYLRGLGVDCILGGEFEEGLASVIARLAKGDDAANVGAANHERQMEPTISLARQKFLTPDRDGLPALEKYARLVMPDGDKRIVGATEASRGCKHLCRHCPIVPVYNGVFRIVDRAVVLADVRQQVAAGAEHITFGDPDFFNGIGHAIPLLEELHREFPRLTYDVTIKIEHLLKHRDLLGTLRDTGCLFVTSAIESVDDAVLARLEKHHTRLDFLRVVEIFRKEGLTLQPTFLPFTPWTTLASYLDLLRVLRENELVENVAPIQLAIRLVIPARSRLLELSDIQSAVGPFDRAALVYPWKHDDERVDALCERLQGIVHAGEKSSLSRAEIFERVEEAACAAADDEAARLAWRVMRPLPSRATVPYLNEPWYC